MKVSGLPDGFHFHDLRHTGNLLASRAGASTGALVEGGRDVSEVLRLSLEERRNGEGHASGVSG